MERIRFTSNGQAIEGTLVTPPEIKRKNPGAIFFHGMTSSEKNYISIAEKLSRHGIVGMTLNIRGHGTSEGNFDSLTVNDGVTDGLNAYDFFARYDFIDLKRISICGGSLGGAIAAMVSSQREVKSLVLRAPATYTEEMMETTYKELMAQEGMKFQKLTNISDTPPVRAISQFKGSLLIITSEKDTVIPVAIPTQYLLDAKNAKKKEIIMIAEATHYLAKQEWRDQFIENTVKWFVQSL